MVQTFRVLRCYQCESFQVDMEKKSAKWQCKMCGERQSLKQVFARGSGPECRKAVQELNLKRMEVDRLEEQKLEAAIIMEEENRELERFAEYMEDEKQHHVMKVEGNLEEAERLPLAPMQAAASGSRWEKFLPSSTSTLEEEEDDLEEVQGDDLCRENRPGPSRGQDAYENLHSVPSKKSKAPFGKRKANNVHIDNTTGNVSSKWGKFSS